jgi:hypothetical protein
MSISEEYQPDDKNADYKSDDTLKMDRPSGVGKMDANQLSSLERSAIDRAENALVLDKKDPNYERLADSDIANRIGSRENQIIDELDSRSSAEKGPTTIIGKIKEMITGEGETREHRKQRIENIKKGSPSEEELTTKVAVASTEMAMEEAGIDLDPNHATPENDIAGNDLAVKARHAVLHKIDPKANPRKYDRYIGKRDKRKAILG